MTPRLAIATQWTDPHTTKISRPLPIYCSFRQCSQGNTNNHFAWSLAQRKISTTHEDPAEQIPLLFYASLIFNHSLFRSLTLLHIQQNPNFFFSSSPPSPISKLPAQASHALLPFSPPQNHKPCRLH